VPLGREGRRTGDERRRFWVALRRGDPDQVTRALAIERFGRMLAKLRIQSGGVMRRRKSKGGPAITLANETPASPTVSQAANARPRFEYTDRVNGDPPPGRSALDRERASLRDV
jgi:hypothetical protein